MAPAGGGSGLRCGSLPGADEERAGRGGSPASPLGAASLHPGGVSAAGAGAGWGRSAAGRAGLGASPPGAAPSDRLPPPLSPQGLRVSAPSA